MECWVCHLKFPTNREMKNHMGPIHGTLKVICPWCPNERTYKRVTDLRSHAKQSHSHQLAKYPGDLITESDGIWFSQRGIIASSQELRGGLMQPHMPECWCWNGCLKPIMHRRRRTTGSTIGSLS